MKRFQILRAKYRGVSADFVRELAHARRFYCVVAVAIAAFNGAGCYLAIERSLALCLALGVAALLFGYIATSEGIDAAHLYRIADWNDMQAVTTPANTI